MLKGTLSVLFAALAASAFADESEAKVLTDKSSASKVMAKYEKLLMASRKEPPTPGGIICIGNSHMELWKAVAEDLAPLSVHNHGIGGRRNTWAALLMNSVAGWFEFPRSGI